MGDKNFWRDWGYRVIEKFDASDQMVIERSEEFSKNKLETLLTENHLDNRQLIQVSVCLTRTEEIKFVVDKIRQLTANEGIDPTEIIVVTLDLNSVKQDLFLIRQALDRLKIRSTTPGFIEDATVFKEKGTVTLTTPFRTKGHEGHVVFVMNAQKAVEDTLLRARNALFVAITRARGWCYITGHGESMMCLENEINSLLADYPYFKLPCTPPDLPRQDSQDKWLDQLIQSHRDLLIERLACNQAMVKAITERADTLCR
jgi:superfamily I DNA and RNA helicase